MSDVQVGSGEFPIEIAKLRLLQVSKRTFFQSAITACSRFLLLAVSQGDLRFSVDEFQRLVVVERTQKIKMIE